MPIYTGRGDEGRTDLRDAGRVSKASPRIEAYGTVDEVNSLVGLARPTGQADVDEKLATVQSHLHVVQADLATPDPGEDDPVVRAAQVEQLEAWMDGYDEELEPLRHFVLPGGSESGARLHHARSVCRRAERRTVALASAAGGEEADGSTEDGDPAGTINPVATTYLNRLSDALFVFARVVNQREGAQEEPPDYRA